MTMREIASARIAGFRSLHSLAMTFCHFGLKSGKTLWSYRLWDIDVVVNRTWSMRP
ncbi:MAG: hypothetical protein ACNA8H_09685 [Anaerolineales bacterium]